MATSILVPQVIALLGVVARAEALYYDDPDNEASRVLFATRPAHEAPEGSEEV